MLQSLKHRGPDSTGFALYNSPKSGEHVLRFKVAEQEDMRHGFQIHDQVRERRAEVDRRLDELGARRVSEEEATEYAYRYWISYDGDMKKLADYVEDVEGAEILSIGNALELVKDLGDATVVSGQYGLASSAALMPSDIPEWRQNPTWIFVLHTPTGLTRSTMSRLCITAS